MTMTRTLEMKLTMMLMEVQWRFHRSTVSITVLPIFPPPSLLVINLLLGLPAGLLTWERADFFLGYNLAHIDLLFAWIHFL